MRSPVERPGSGHVQQGAATDKAERARRARIAKTPRRDGKGGGGGAFAKSQSLRPKQRGCWRENQVAWHCFVTCFYGENPLHGKLVLLTAIDSLKCFYYCNAQTRLVLWFGYRFNSTVHHTAARHTTFSHSEIVNRSAFFYFYFRGRTWMR